MARGENANQVVVAIAVEPSLDSGSHINAPVHRELPNRSPSDLAEPQPGSDAVERLVSWPLNPLPTVHFPCITYGSAVPVGIGGYCLRLSWKGARDLNIACTTQPCLKAVFRLSSGRSCGVM